MAKHIEFFMTGKSQSGKTSAWVVKSKYDHHPELGYVAWFPRWRKYCFFPLIDTVYEQDCLRDIADFCEKATREHKAGKEKTDAGT